MRIQLSLIQSAVSKSCLHVIKCRWNYVWQTRTQNKNY